MIEKLNSNDVVIKFNTIDDINPDKPLSQQLDLLKEDLLQLEIGDDYIIDVGYYPEFALNGEFKIFTIKDYDWSEPFRIKCCKTFELLIEYIQESINEVTKK